MISPRGSRSTATPAIAPSIAEGTISVSSNPPVAMAVSDCRTDEDQDGVEQRVVRAVARQPHQPVAPERIVLQQLNPLVQQEAAMLDHALRRCLRLSHGTPRRPKPPRASQQSGALPLSRLGLLILLPRRHQPVPSSRERGPEREDLHTSPLHPEQPLTIRMHRTLRESRGRSIAAALRSKRGDGLG